MRPPQFAGESLHRARGHEALDLASMRPPQFAGESPDGDRRERVPPLASMRPPQFAGESIAAAAKAGREDPLQ